MPKSNPNPTNAGPDDTIKIAKSYGFEAKYTNKRQSPWPHSYKKESRYVVPCYVEGEGQGGWRSCDLGPEGFVNSEYHLDFREALERGA